MRQPVEHLRAVLAQSGVEVPAAAPHLRDQVKAQFRFDLTSLGVDTGNVDQLGGAIAGLASMTKAMLLFAIPPDVIVHFVTLFDCVESVLDDDLESVIHLARGDFSSSRSLPHLGGPGFSRETEQGSESVVESTVEDSLVDKTALLEATLGALDSVTQALDVLRQALTRMEES